MDAGNAKVGEIIFCALPGCKCGITGIVVAQHSNTVQIEIISARYVTSGEYTEFCDTDPVERILTQDIV